MKTLIAFLFLVALATSCKTTFQWNPTQFGPIGETGFTVGKSESQFELTYQHDDDGELVWSPDSLVSHGVSLLGQKGTNGIAVVHEQPLASPPSSEPLGFLTMVSGTLGSEESQFFDSETYAAARKSFFENFEEISKFWND